VPVTRCEAIATHAMILRAILENAEFMPHMRNVVKRKIHSSRDHTTYPRPRPDAFDPPRMEDSAAGFRRAAAGLGCGSMGHLCGFFCASTKRRRTAFIRV
jgi:hypothetical protein